MKSELQVQNLKCGGCANTITTHLLKLEGIQTVHIEQDTATIAIDHEHQNNLGQVREKLRTLGYPVSSEGNGILLKAKSYISCATGKFN